LDGISLSLQAGRITSVLGASGCGKTTLLRALAGIESVDGGEILSDIARPGPAVGFLQQGERLLPWRTVLQNACLGMELLGQPREVALQEARQALTKVGLGAFEQCYPSQISGGMAQRLLVARTLLTKPQLLLLDEPLGQLDLIARKELAGLIREYVCSSGCVALLVTHSVEEAVFISDEVITLSRGPARIFSRHTISDEQGSSESGVLSRSASFDIVQQSLLAALQQDRIQSEEA
jgi:ABC-type nitrate/sulfonate/bicarbonate transport system ATPase subunit